MFLILWVKETTSRTAQRGPLTIRKGPRTIQYWARLCSEVNRAIHSSCSVCMVPFWNIRYAVDFGQRLSGRGAEEAEELTGGEARPLCEYRTSPTKRSQADDCRLSSSRVHVDSDSDRAQLTAELRQDFLLLLSEEKSVSPVLGLLPIYRPLSMGCTTTGQ